MVDSSGLTGLYPRSRFQTNKKALQAAEAFCIGYLSVAMIKRHAEKPACGRQSLFWLTFPVGKIRRRVKAATSRQDGRRRELRVHTLSCKQETEGELEMTQGCKL